MFAKIFLKKIFIAIGIIIAGLGLFIAYMVNLMINRPHLGRIRNLEDKDFEQFFSKNENKDMIYSIYYPGKPKNPIVILCHGHGVGLGNMGDMIPYLKKLETGILLFDFRAHGKSEGKLCSIGLLEWQDIKAVISTAKKKGFIKKGQKIVAYGRSMGAASLINGAKHLNEIDAFILESSFEKLRNVAARDAKHKIGIPDSFLVDLTFWLTEKITSINYTKNNPEERIADIGSRTALIIHDELDHRANLNAFNSLKEKLPGAETFIASGARHVQAHTIHPQEFEKLFKKILLKVNAIDN
jgi:hypothetical protein